jgi:hypothetical protein
MISIDFAETGGSAARSTHPFHPGLLGIGKVAKVETHAEADDDGAGNGMYAAGLVRRWVVTAGELSVDRVDSVVWFVANTPEYGGGGDVARRCRS